MGSQLKINDNVKYLISGSIAVFVIWLLLVSNEKPYSRGTLLLGYNGKPTESGYMVNDNLKDSKSLLSAKKIYSLLDANNIDDLKYSNKTTFSSNRIKQLIDDNITEINKKLDKNALFLNAKIDSLINDTKMGKFNTFSSEKILSLLRPQVYFDAVINTSIKISGDITFDSFIAQSPNSGMDLKTGKFKCRVPGLYRFTFTGLRYFFANRPVEARVRLIHNSVFVATAATMSVVSTTEVNPRPPGGESLNINTLLTVNKDDVIWCRIDCGGIFDEVNEHFTHFTGELLHSM